MKIKYSFIALLFTILAVSCNDAEYDIVDNAIYFEETEKGSSSKVSVNRLGLTSASLNVRLGHPVSADVMATISINKDILDEYNVNNATSYQVLPTEFLTFDKSVVIKAGETSAEVTNFEVTTFSTPNSEQYAIPVTITDVVGSMSTLSSSKNYIILLSKPLFQDVPQMINGNTTSNASGDLWGIKTQEWTIETWVKMSKYNINNQAIINSGEGPPPLTEIYIRFGDLPIGNRSLQLKTAGSQLNTKFQFEDNKWYHVAFVFTRTGMTSIFVNGNEDAKAQLTAGEATINMMQFAASNGMYFPNKCQMAQVRMWSKALSQSQIQANMNYEVNPNDPNLLAYWKLNAGEGNSYVDSSPNGRHLEAAGSPITWIDDVDFKN